MPDASVGVAAHFAEAVTQVRIDFGEEVVGIHLVEHCDDGCVDQSHQDCGQSRDPRSASDAVPTSQIERPLC